MSLAADIPFVAGPLINKDGTVSQAWWAFFRQLWVRTGSGPGISAADLELLLTLAAALKQANDPQARSVAQGALLEALRPARQPVDYTTPELFALAQHKAPCGCGSDDAKLFALGLRRPMPAAAATATGANPTASVGLAAVNGSALTFLRSDGAPALDVTIAPTWSGKHIWSSASAASAPVAYFTGAVQTGGSGTTNFPHVLIQPSTATASTTWSTTGTAFGINVHAGVANLVDFKLDGVTVFKVDAGGLITSAPTSFNPTVLTVPAGYSGTPNISVGGTPRIGFTSFSGSQPTVNFMSGIGFATSATSTADAQIVRKAAASLQFGLQDGAAPVAQSLSFQSVVAGTSNIAGANATIKASQSTGNANGGDIIFQTAKAGTSGTAQNALATVLTISNTGVIVTAPLTVATLPAASAALTGGRSFVTDGSTTLILGLGLTAIGGGANKVPVYCDGTNWIVG